jgi:RimJ/RimL family protein N-acetyltransferase
MVEAIFFDREAILQGLVEATLPHPWPGRALIERAFCADLDAIRKDPDQRLWGDRIILESGVRTDTSGRLDEASRSRRVLGSVIFHGRPDAEGVVEVAYGIERHSQGMGVASEALSAQVAWALAQEGVRTVRATTPPWHAGSRRVLEKCGFAQVGEDEHESLGEVVVYARG